MTVLPFLCIGLGIGIGLCRRLPPLVFLVLSRLMNCALMLLMMLIGANAGMNRAVWDNLGTIGFHCTVLAFSAILFSVLFAGLAEKTVMPLERLRLEAQEGEFAGSPPQDEVKKSSFLIIVPVCLAAGLAVGRLVLPPESGRILSVLLTIALVCLYMGAGAEIGKNNSALSFIRRLGLRVLFLPLGVLAGSLVGGLLAGALLGISRDVAVLSAAGMSYYSITGAYLSQTLGPEAGTYGFLVNVLREMMTVVLLPLLVRVGKSAPIAAGAAGNMDTMFVPVTKVIGTDLGVAALLTGTILTFLVPALLPALHLIV